MVESRSLNGPLTMHCRQTSGCATLEYLTIGQTLSMWMESGAGSDCTFETSFSYNHLNVMLLMASEQVATFANGPFAG